MKLIQKQQALYKVDTSHSFFFNILAFLFLITALIFISWGTREITAPIAILKYQAISLDAGNLVHYSFRTVLRMLLAIILSLVFTFIYATLAAKSKKCEQILIPLLDILQSVPVIGYISFTVTGFLALFQSSMLGPECAVIFAIFTSQAWNITFSFYGSLKTIPTDLDDVAQIFHLSKWRKFWQIEVPFALPGVVWNIVISMSASWFFIVASEVISVGNHNIALPGIGSYIGLAIQQQDMSAIYKAIIAMSIMIISYDQLILKPLVVWSQKFRYEMTSDSQNKQTSIIFEIFQNSIFIKKLFSPLLYLGHFLLYLPILNHSAKYSTGKQNLSDSVTDIVWYMCISIIFVVMLYIIYVFLHEIVGFSETYKVFKFGCYTMIRIVILVSIASIIWVPIGIYIGLNSKLTSIMQPIAQFLGALPVNLFFPIIFTIITQYDLDPNIWLSPLMIMGTQWYILFNVIVGASSIPTDLREAAKLLNISGIAWWTKIMLPAIFPHFIVGAITASGGAWNASILSEIINFGDRTIVAQGLGSYIAEMTVKADYNKIILGIGMMSCFVIVINRLFWHPINRIVERKFQI